ncbi:hypothetical protein HYALB_00003837 [Hymenoscyphus albidus]|uniref:Uncharacterized protein n=1 Tax=Hymenoscyphus albidus TaxID=595503 RepID=A0A9N9QAM6_9HELO|nr:hypothetical protein HYALB_00003837 [Hymenoscyphus albidus]
MSSNRLSNIMVSDICNTGIQLHGFTPVRRRVCDINTRQQIGGEREQEWTTARCHRLLRALTSRVAILKKELSLISGTAQGSNQIGAKVTKPTRQRSSYPDDDADWTKKGSSKNKVKRTYSNRGGRNTGARNAPNTPRTTSLVDGRKALILGEIHVPTPILARARGELSCENHDSSLTDCEADWQQIGKLGRPSNHPESSLQLSGSIRSMRQTTEASRYAIYEGLYNGLETLLRSTNEPAKVSRKGSRSLFSMCLRAVPEYIEQEENASLAYLEETGTKSSIDTRDIATEIYDDLEYLGTSGHGWKHLRIVVRSHGIKVLADAIRAGLLDVSFCSILITLCHQNFATEEAELLLSSLLASGPFQAPKTPYDQIPRPLLLLRKFTEATGRHTFQYQELASLLSNGSLPVGWLATKDFRAFWTGVVQRISPESMDSGVLEFLEISIPLIAGTDYFGKGFTEPILQAIESTFSSLLTTILSILILSTETGEVASSNTCGSLIALFRGSLQQFEALYPSEDPSVMLLVANLFAEVFGNSGHGSSFIEHLVNQIREVLGGCDDNSTVCDDVAALICSMARCCGRGSASMGFEHLELLHSTLENATQDMEGTHYFQGFIFDSAMAFANQSPEPAHINYATMIEKKFGHRKMPPENQSKLCEAANPGIGFRWEEGIGEWITATPINSLKKYNVFNTFTLIKTTSQRESLPLRQKRAWETFSSGSTRSNQSSAAEPFEVVESVDGGITDGNNSDSSSILEEESIFSEVSICSSSSSISRSRVCSDLSEPDQAPSKRRRLRASQSRRSFDDFYTTSMSSSASSSHYARKLRSGRNDSDRAPKLESRACRSSQTRQTTSDDSDDELSILSVSMSQPESGTLGLTSCRGFRDRRSKRVQTSKRRKSIAGRRASLEAESEDELCL